jgi:hypothetical protein
MLAGTGTAQRGGGHMGGGYRGGGAHVGGGYRGGGVYAGSGYRGGYYGGGARWGGYGYGYRGYGRWGYGSSFYYGGYWPYLGVGYWPGYYGSPYYSDSYYSAGYSYPYGYQYPYQQPGVTMVYPYSSAPSTVAANPAYSSTRSSYGQETAAPRPGASPIYLIALNDRTIRAAEAYWVDGPTLHYVTLQHEQRQTPLDAVDRALTLQLNRERHIPFQWPAAQ